MTDEQAEALGRRALTAGFPAWAEPVMYRCRFCEGYMRGTGGSPPAGGWWPDFRDETGATLGVLVAQVRAKRGDLGLYCRNLHSGTKMAPEWLVVQSEAYAEPIPVGGDDVSWDGFNTEADAWVAALEVGR